MKLKIIILFLLTLIFALPINAQDNSPKQENQTLSEDEHLPFMQKETVNQPEETSNSGLIFRSFGLMFLIVGLIFGGAWTLKKFGFGKNNSVSAENSPEVTVLSKISLGNNQTISTIRFGERILLVGATPQQFTLLADEFIEANLDDKKPRSVAELLADEKDFEGELEKAKSLYSFEKGDEI